MVRRTAKRGANAGSEFWGCTGYPTCRGHAPDRLNGDLTMAPSDGLDDLLLTERLACSLDALDPGSADVPALKGSASHRRRLVADSRPIVVDCRADRHAHLIHRCWSSACPECPTERCTPSEYRRSSRWGDEHILDPRPHATGKERSTHDGRFFSGTLEDLVNPSCFHV
jgi:ssDNA-binding Zn-finger/Zn-ribbon topoisomerase 1